MALLGTESLLMGLALAAGLVYGATAAALEKNTAVDEGLALQVALDRAGFSPGEIDGTPGARTSAALRAFQESRQLSPTGRLDEPTIEALGAPFREPLVTYVVVADDTRGPFINAVPDDMMELARLEAPGYASVSELLAERFHASPALLKRLNPHARFHAGERIAVPNVEVFDAPTQRPQSTAPPPAPARIIVTAQTRTLHVTDGQGRTIMFAPVSVGSERDPLPVGQWMVTGVHYRPVFHYNPDLFWDAEPTHAKAKVAPGPNNPVGLVWIDLDREHYGIHGTPVPSTVGQTQSHGCVRLTNWDALRLARLVGKGTPVTFR